MVFSSLSVSSVIRYDKSLCHDMLPNCYDKFEMINKAWIAPDVTITQQEPYEMTEFQPFALVTLWHRRKDSPFKISAYGPVNSNPKVYDTPPTSTGLESPSLTKWLQHCQKPHAKLSALPSVEHLWYIPIIISSFVIMLDPLLSEMGKGNNYVMINCLYWSLSAEFEFSPVAIGRVSLLIKLLHAWFLLFIPYCMHAVCPYDVHQSIPCLQ